MTSKLVLDHLIATIGELPPLPSAARKALDTIHNPASNMAELAQAVTLDPVLTSLALRWVNSPYYGLRSQVATVQQAVTVLGHQALKDLIMTASFSALLQRPVQGYGLKQRELWRHAIGVAAGARLLMQDLGHPAADEAYHAGLLCDIGKLALEMLLRDQRLEAEAWQGLPFVELEKQHFGVDHAELGSEMARRWDFPAPLVEAIAYHHCPEQAGVGADLAAAVHLADAAMLVLGIGIGRDGLQYALDPEACRRMQWDDDKLSAFIQRVLPYITEADRLIHNRS